jgi:serine protease
MRNARRSVVLTIIITALTAVGTLVVSGGAAQASQAPSGASTTTAAGFQPYRHGWVPLRGAQAPGTSRSSSHVAAGHRSGPSNDLSYRGGIDNVGVTSGTPQVYLVFYGSQWGTQSTNANGYTVFSGDPNGIGPDLQAFYSGLGTSNELWSGVMTQYCEGVAVGTVSCPTSSSHVAYPSSGGVLKGVWEDTSLASPPQATAGQLGQEAESAAAHFGNATTSENRDAQYVIVSPTGTHPDGFNTPGGQFCAWHDYTGDSAYLGNINQAPTGGPVAFTNMPYVTDMGASCGENFVNSGSAGLLDGVTIVGGHEYAETLTDQFPAGGWIDSSGSENGDKCAWISSGQGAATDLALGSGSFAVQSTWANDFNGGAGGCELAHPVVTSIPTNTISVANAGSQDTNQGATVNLGLSATDSGGLSVSWSASGLPAGLGITSTGATSAAITGIPTTGGTSSVTVTAVDTSGGSGSTSFAWRINAVTVTNPGNQTTNSNTAVSLAMHATDTSPSPSLLWAATGLPPGLSINASNGVISGTTQAAAPAAAVTVTANDTVTHVSGSAAFSWTVATGPNTITVSNPGSQSTKRNTSVTLQMSATDSGGLTVGWTASGLPQGLSISASGRISGKPTRIGTSTVTVTATDASGAKASTSFTWMVRS